MILKRILLCLMNLHSLALYVHYARHQHEHEHQHKLDRHAPTLALSNELALSIMLTMPI